MMAHTISEMPDYIRQTDEHRRKVKSQSVNVGLTKGVTV